LNFVEGLYACATRDAFKQHVVHALPKIIRSDIQTYNDVDLESGQIDWFSNADREIPDGKEIFRRYMHEHPFLTYRNAGYDDLKAATLSDFVGQRAWRETALYNGFYRAYQIEHMLGIPLAVPHPRELQIVALRNARDFDQRDRLAFDLLAPHCSAAVARVEAIRDLGFDLAALREGLESDGRAVLALGPGGRIRQMSERAQDWLTAYFGAHWPNSAALPLPIDEWLRRQRQSAVDEGELGMPRTPLVVERDGNRLTVRVLSERDGTVLLLSERKLRIGREDLASLGLSRRESEVLAWLAGGKTNGAIAEILGLSPITIKHCVERIYAKLDVRTRAAATAIAIAAADARA
jgi:DNA-binding CsgD family transcriptional regulator